MRTIQYTVWCAPTAKPTAKKQANSPMPRPKIQPKTGTHSGWPAKRAARNPKSPNTMASASARSTKLTSRKRVMVVASYQSRLTRLGESGDVRMSQ